MASNQNLELYKPAIAQLTDLLTITGTYVDQYYNIFLNPEPISNVEIKAYDSNGEIQTITIPNLAYLRQNCIIGEGSPEGNVSAPLGTFYLDTSVETNGLYIKKGNELEVSNTGWGLLASMDSVTEDIANVERELNQSITTVYEELTGKINTLLPSQTNIIKKFLMTDSGTLSWEIIDTPVIELGNMRGTYTLEWGKVYRGTILDDSVTITFANVPSYPSPTETEVQGTVQPYPYVNTIWEFKINGTGSISLSPSGKYYFNYDSVPTYVNGTTGRITFDTIDNGITINTYFAQRTK